MNELLILTLLNINRVSRKTINTILEIIEGLIVEEHLKDFVEEDIIEIFKQAALKYKRISIPNLENVKDAKQKAKNIINRSREENIYSITILDSDFPNKLKSIPDPPVILFYKGNRQCLLTNKAIAIIGTREPTLKGKEKAEQLGNLFTREGFVIVSGLAKGCDELGHKGCVDVQGKSIAVLPGGLDKIYPASNKSLAESILKYDGCLISEYPIGSRPFKNNFVERDRIQSALSEAVIVVETNVSGGTMHTAEFALEQKKILACYKHSEEYINNEQTHGNIKLMNERKAIGIYTKNDIKNLQKLIEEKIEESENGSSKISISEEVAVQTKLI